MHIKALASKQKHFRKQTSFSKLCHQSKSRNVITGKKLQIVAVYINNTIIIITNKGREHIPENTFSANLSNRLLLPTPTKKQY